MKFYQLHEKGWNHEILPTSWEWVKSWSFAQLHENGWNLQLHDNKGLPAKFMKIGENHVILPSS